MHLGGSEAAFGVPEEEFYSNRFCIYLLMNNVSLIRLWQKMPALIFTRGASRSEAMELVLRRGSRQPKQP